MTTIALFHAPPDATWRQVTSATAANTLPSTDFAASVWIEELIALIQQAIAEDDDEDLRRIREDEILRRVPYLKAAGLFEVFHIAHPALRAMIEDHLQR
jgi:hypothetical protein